MTQNLISKFLSQSLTCYLIEKCQPQQEQETRRQVEECLRFLYLSHLTKGSIPVCQKVDDIWHLLILQTKEYFELCQNLPAKNYIHHSSNVYLNYCDEKLQDIETPEDEAKRQLQWLVSYVVNFGNLTDGNIQYWSFANALCLKFKLSLDELNTELKNLSTLK